MTGKKLFDMVGFGSDAKLRKLRNLNLGEGIIAIRTRIMKYEELENYVEHLRAESRLDIGLDHNKYCYAINKKEGKRELIITRKH